MKFVKIKNMLLIVAICLISVLSAADSPAVIIDTTGAVTVVPAPASVSPGDAESNTIIRIFNEKQDYVLPNDILVDISQTGYNNWSPLTIPYGTHVNSYFLHLDPEGTTSADVNLVGSVIFREPILGVIVTDQKLIDSDSLGAPGTIYPTYTSFRGLEANPDGVDLINLFSPTLGVWLYASGEGIDQVRVITGRLPLAVDVDPRTCPNPLRVRGGGDIRVAILGTSDFDVTSVDPNSIRLQGVTPSRNRLGDVATPYYPFTGKLNATDCTDQGRDGFDDLLMSFSKNDILNALGPVLNDGDVYVLQLTGRLVDGTAIMGEDVVVIRR